MYKHVAKQRKLTDSNKEARLSDEDDLSDDDDPSSDEAATASEGSDSDSDFGEDEDVILPASAILSDEEEVADTIELKEPPKGFPSAEEALKNPIAEPEKEEGEGDDDVQPVCVVCPSKALKRGKMLDVHLASKDHKRRLNRFTAHVQSADFPATSLPLDARAICVQLDTIVFNRLSEQTLHGGPSTSAAKAKKEPEPKKELSAEDQVKLAGAQERQSRRAELRAEKKLQHVERRNNKKEKIQRLKARRERERAAKPEGETKKVWVEPKDGSAKKVKAPKSAAKVEEASPAAKPKSDTPKKERKPKQKKEITTDAVETEAVAPSPAASKKRKAKATPEGKDDKKAKAAVV
ncbi:hypothetical protein P7C70_g8222, partial [Phenoliferia sp. Uapishka_3]